jgi:peptide chain release factor 2
VASPGFWDDQARAQQKLKELGSIKEPLESWTRLSRRVDDLGALVELVVESLDPDLAAEAQADAAAVEKEVQQFELTILLNDRYAKNGAILTLHGGAGGTEAMDWTQMLYRMYTRWAEQHRYKVEVLDMLEGEEAGLKSVTMAVRGPYAYGFLRAEMGVHRLVRISPFDASGRRHTSFAAVEVMPEVEEDNTDVVIRPEDLRVDTFRASGAGGQHVNRTESAVRITHLPTGIVVSCQQERSQIQNRATAMSMLRAKLLELKLEEQNKELAQVRGPQMEIAWGSQIRSYVFQPYTLVKDHRTGYEVGNIQAVMDGDLDGFINEYLRQKATGTLGTHKGGAE